MKTKQDLVKVIDGFMADLIKLRSATPLDRSKIWDYEQWIKKIWAMMYKQYPYDALKIAEKYSHVIKLENK